MVDKLAEHLDKVAVSRVEAILNWKQIVIVGYAASGKTTFSEKFAKDYPDHRLIHTDDYIQFGYEPALYKLISDIQQTEGPFIVEGVLGYRLLRKGIQGVSKEEMKAKGIITDVELWKWQPDLVITCECPTETRIKRYLKRGGDANKLLTFDKNLNTVWYDYKSLLKKEEKQPEFDFEPTFGPATNNQ